MAIADITAVYANIVASAAGGALRMSSDLSESADEDRDSWGAGGTRFQIRATYTGLERKVDSNTSYHTWSVEIAVHHKLALASNERTWTEGVMPGLQQTLADPLFWEDDDAKAAGVYAFISADFTQAPTREGNVVSFAVEGIIRTT